MPGATCVTLSGSCPRTRLRLLTCVWIPMLSRSLVSSKTRSDHRTPRSPHRVPGCHIPPEDLGCRPVPTRGAPASICHTTPFFRKPHPRAAAAALYWLPLHLRRRTDDMAESTSLRRAKRPRSAIAGPYGHPFHPILVTIPIGTWVASLVFDIVGLASDDPTPYVIGARILILIGLIGAVLAAIWGFLDYSQLEKGTAAKRTATIHMALNLGVTVLFL